MIYYIYDKLNNAVKIGYAKNVKTRFNTYLTHNINPLLLIYIVDGDMVKETQTHQQYQHLTIRTEWFKCEDQLLNDLIVYYGSDFTQIDAAQYEELNTNFFKQNAKSGYAQYLDNLKTESRKTYERQRRVSKMNEHLSDVGETLSKLFVKKDNSYIVIKDLPTYLKDHDVKSLTGEKTLRATKIAECFDVVIKTKRVNKKHERCIMGLDYAK